MLQFLIIPRSTLKAAQNGYIAQTTSVIKSASVTVKSSTTTGRLEASASPPAAPAPATTTTTASSGQSASGVVRSGASKSGEKCWGAQGMSFLAVGVGLALLAF